MKNNAKKLRRKYARKRARLKRMSGKRNETMPPDKDEHQYVTISEFENWTRTWLIEKFINSSQEPGVITANAPICFFMRDIMKERIFPKDTTMEEKKKLFYVYMLELYRLILKSDEGHEHAPYLQSNHINTIQYAQQCLSGLEGNGESADIGT
jgi:hypothetical protein